MLDHLGPEPVADEAPLPEEAPAAEVTQDAFSGEVYHVGSTYAWITPLGALPSQVEASLAKEQVRAEQFDEASAELRGRIRVDLASLMTRYSAETLDGSHLELQNKYENALQHFSEQQRLLGAGS